MDLAVKLRCMDLRSSSFFSSSSILKSHKTRLRSHFSVPIRVNSSNRKTSEANAKPGLKAKITAVAIDNAEVEQENSLDIESLFSSNDTDSSKKKRGNKKAGGGASSISSGIRLENISKSFKGVTVLKDISWEVKKGEKVGLVGVNGAGKTTQMRIIAGLDEPDSGNVLKARENMKIAFLSQEFEVCQSRTVKEEFQSAFKEEMDVAERLEKVQKALESSVEDLGLMGRLLDELDLLQRRARDVDLNVVDVKINKLMPELGFSPEDSEQLVASFSGGWQMRMCLGKILLQVYININLKHINSLPI